jgi:predicted nucleic acid-binding protein
VSEEAGTAPEQWVVDVGVLVELARANVDVTRLLLNLDAQGQSLVIPVLGMAAASADARTEDADVTLRGLEQLDNVQVAPMRDAEQAARLAAIAARAELEYGDAHVAAVAIASGCPILTLDAAKWQQIAVELDEPLETIEIAEPPEG